MASALMRTSVRRVVSAATAPARSGGEGLTVRRAVSLSPSSIRRVLCSSGAQGEDQPPMSREEKIIEQVEEILAKKTLAEDVVKDIALSAIEIRCEVNTKERSRHFWTSLVLLAGGVFGFSYSKSRN